MSVQRTGHKHDKTGHKPSLVNHFMFGKFWSCAILVFLIYYC